MSNFEPQIQMHSATIVTGQADPTIDVPAIQQAVDAGGIVVLRGTFDFGEEGRVILRKDVLISGHQELCQPETQVIVNSMNGSFRSMRDNYFSGGFSSDFHRDNPLTKHSKFENGLTARRRDMAIIRGGDCPFISDNQSVSVTIQNIWFDGPRSLAIGLLAAHGQTQILNNRITNVQAGIHPATQKPGVGGILLSNHVRYANGEGYSFAPKPNDFTIDEHITVHGEIRVANNEINLDPLGNYCHDDIRAVGIESTQTNAQTTISDNIVKNTSHAGILVVDNFQPHIVTENYVQIHDYPDGRQILYPTNSSFGGEGIAVVAFHFLNQPGATSLISDNTISSGGDASAKQNGGAGPAAVGIMISGPQTVLNNHIHMEGGYAAILIVTRPQSLFDQLYPGFMPKGDSSGAMIGSNRCSGHALALCTAKGRRDTTFDQYGPGSSNRATHNTIILRHAEVEHFRAKSDGAALLYLSEHMHENTIILESEESITVTDLGKNNQLFSEQNSQNLEPKAIRNQDHIRSKTSGPKTSALPSSVPEGSSIRSIKTPSLSVAVQPNEQAVGLSETEAILLHPTGRYPDDLYQVQAAVDANPGGVVRLAPGIFNFGDDVTGRGSVLLRRSISIVGTFPGDSPGNSSRNIPATKIQGGYKPFESTAGTSVTIQGIWFDDALSSAIRLNGIEGENKLMGNKITNMVGFPLDPATRGYHGIAAAIRVEDGQGNLWIVGNDIDVDPHGRFPDFFLGIGINTRRLGGKVVVQRNQTRHTSHGGILLLDTTGSAFVYENDVDTGSVSAPSTSTYGLEGIVAVAQQLPTSQQGTAHIHNNRIKVGGSEAGLHTPHQLGGPGPIALGLMLCGPHIATHNHVTIEKGLAGVLLWTNRAGLGDARNALIVHNHFQGDAKYLYREAGLRKQPEYNQALDNLFVVGKEKNIQEMTFGSTEQTATAT
ncbi:MAG: hypothetical protein AAF702_31445 [Chloroflexota bacterium]